MRSNQACFAFLLLEPKAGLRFHQFSNFILDTCGHKPRPQRTGEAISLAGGHERGENLFSIKHPLHGVQVLAEFRRAYF